MIHVLLVDDDPALFNITKILLEKDGELLVELCSSVHEAMGMLEKRAYDVIISDYDMPGKDGIEFFRELRKNDCDTPFIMFTGKGNENTVITALNYGIDYYLKKGKNPKEVFSELRSAVRYITSSKKDRLTGRSRLQDRRSSFFPDFVLVTDPDGIIRYADPYLEKLLKLPEGSMQSRSLLGFITPHWRERAQTNLFISRPKESSEGAKNQVFFDLDLLINDGSSLPVELLIKNIAGSPGHPAELFLIGSSLPPIDP